MFPKNFRASLDLRKHAARIVAAVALSLTALVPLWAQTTSQVATTAPAVSLVTNRLTRPVDENARITLKGTVHPLANAANDRGPAPASMPLDRIQVVLKRSDAQEAALKQLISDMHTPGKANYHKWLTPDQFGAQFGPSDQDIATLSAWLQSKGFNVTKVNPGKQTLEMSGSVSQFNTAFHTQIRKYAVNGQTRYSNSIDPQIPEALSPVFGGFTSLNNFHPRSFAKVLGKATYTPKSGTAVPQWTIGSGNSAEDLNFVLSPKDFGVQYDLPNPTLNAGFSGTTYDGTGQTIAIINGSNINVAQVNQFRSVFGLPANPPQVIIDGNDPGIDEINSPNGPSSGESVEAYLDVEWAGAVAPGATIDLVTAEDTALEYGLFLAAEHAVYGNIAPVISMSYGECEAADPSLTTGFASLWEQAAAQGITVMVSSGDAGSAQCDSDEEFATNGQAVNGWGSSPYNVSVGGTDFFYSSYNAGTTAINTQLAQYWNTTPSNETPAASINGYIPEQPWNDSQYGLNIFSYYADSQDSATTVTGGGGGASNCAIFTASGACNGGYPKPSWQAGAGVPADGVRDLPDLSLFAANGENDSYYPLCASDGDCQTGGDSLQITGVGGTSASSPAFAGIMALVNQKYGRQGQADFVLYPLKTQYPAAFHDITVGTNAQPCLYSTSLSATHSPDCIAASSPIVLTDSDTGETFTEGEIGTGTTPEYNAAAGYNLATGLGTVDASQMLTNWGNVKFAASSVTLTPSENSFTHGTAITVSGSVTAASGTPSGNVALMTDSTEPLQQGQSNFPLTNGAFSSSVNYLPGGTYNIWGQYSGDGTNALSTSQKTQITVTPEASSVYFNVFAPGNATVPSGTSNIPYGTQLLLSAQPVPTTDLTALANCQTGASTTCPTFSTPTGTVSFTDTGINSNLSALLNTAPLNAEGDAELNAPFAVGAHSVLANYSGDYSYNASTSSPVSFTIAKDTPEIEATTVLDTEAGAAAGVVGQQTSVVIQLLNTANLNAENANNTGYAVPAAPPTGTVTISGGPSGFPTSATLSSNTDAGTYSAASIAQVVFPTTTPAGTYNLTLSYAGDGNYTAATTVTLPVQIVSAGGKASTTAATVTGSISPTTTVTISGTVTGTTGGPAPTSVDGGVVILASGYEVAQPSLVPGTGNSSTFSAVLNSESLTQGANYITVQFLGDNTYSPSSVVLSTAINNPLSDFSLVPASTIVTLPSLGNTGGATTDIDTATDAITVTSTNGFTGIVNLTCTGTGGVECSLNPAAPALTAGGSTTVTASINNSNVATTGTYNVVITGADAATGEFVHTVGLSVIAPATNLPPGLTVAGPTSLTIQNPGDTATATLTVSPAGGLTGSSTVACSIQGAPAGITCAATGTTAANQSSTLTVTTTDSVAIGNYTAEIVATQGSVTSNTLSIPITVNAAAAIALTNSGPVTISSPGGSGTSTISVTPAGGFTGNVTLACSVTTSPSGAIDTPTCSIPTPLDITTSAAATATLTVTTTAASTSSLQRPLDKLFAVGGGIAVAGLLLFTIPARRRSWRSILGILVFAGLVGVGIGCGGGGSSGGGGGGGGGNSGTTTGAYVITVTGTDAATGKITGSTTVNVTVN